MQRIPFLSLAPQHATIHADVTAALTAGFEKNWFVLGDSLQAFEAEYARFSATTYCCGVGNGFDALHISLQACGIGPGDEVIVPANTYVATWLAVSKTGARVVPVEPDPLTLNINAEEVVRHITPRTKAILPVHLYGQPCDMTQLVKIGTQHKLMIVEDNAQAHGARWNDRVTGSFGLLNATSFYPTKNLGALGDGGAITSNDKDLISFVRQYRNYGFSGKNNCEIQGVNSRLDELQAAVLRIKLKHLDDWNSQRRAIASKYLSLLDGIEGLRLPFTCKEAMPVYHLFVVQTTRRDALKDYLSDCGIETMIHYPVPPHLQPAYKPLGFKPGDFPVTESIAKTSLSLPLWPGMKDDDLYFICGSITRFFA